MGNKIRPPLTSPAGPSRLPQELLGREFGWNLDSSGTTRALTCELCGTEHPELPENADGRVYFSLLGLQIVEDCCGAVVDRLFAEAGEQFAMMFLESFALNPGAVRFGLLRRELPKILLEAAKAIAQTASQIEEAEAAASKLGPNQ